MIEYIDYDMVDHIWIDRDWKEWLPDGTFQTTTRVIVIYSETVYPDTISITPDDYEEIEKCIGWVQNKITNLTILKEQLLKLPSQK